MEITIQLDDETAERVQDWASFTEQDLSQVFKNIISSSFPPALSQQYTPVAKLSDDAVLAAASTKERNAFSQRIDQLLIAQRESIITPDEQIELNQLMQQYHELWVYQSKALVEAVNRGLMPPMSDGDQ